MTFHQQYYNQLKGYRVSHVTFEDDGMGGVFPKLHMWNLKADKGYEKVEVELSSDEEGNAGGFAFINFPNSEAADD